MNKLLCSAAILLAVSTALAQAPAAPVPVTFDEAVTNEKQLFEADQKHDLDTVRRIVADDFVDIAKNGSSISKTILLAEIPKLKLVRAAQSNFRVVALGPYAYSISYDSDATVIGADGKQTRNQNGLNSVWIRRDGRWQLLLHCRGTSSVLRAKE